MRVFTAHKLTEHQPVKSQLDQQLQISLEQLMCCEQSFSFAATADVWDLASKQQNPRFVAQNAQNAEVSRAFVQDLTGFSSSRAHERNQHIVQSQLHGSYACRHIADG